ncbi:hypothetical protein GCM10010271_62710 [Streptomyces kurssanovii]|nr:hypothetical protein GCM10010271_62710 [Streptomyces kurssanovii]
MDNREEVREFLSSRRAKTILEQVDPPAGPRRRVPGLRRSEVAAPADMSVEYYAKLERGNLAGASPAVLETAARALRLDDAERAHLLHLAQAADGSDALTRPRRRAATRQWTPHHSLQWTLGAITAGPAVVTNGRMDVLAANPLARAFYADMFTNGDNQRNQKDCACSPPSPPPRRGPRSASLHRLKHPAPHRPARTPSCAAHAARTRAEGDKPCRKQPSTNTRRYGGEPHFGDRLDGRPGPGHRGGAAHRRTPCGGTRPQPSAGNRSAAAARPRRGRRHGRPHRA